VGEGEAAYNESVCVSGTLTEWNQFEQVANSDFLVYDDLKYIYCVLYIFDVVIKV
jgi:hypothetical protein